MSNISLRRDHLGKLHLRVGSEYALGSEVTSVVMNNGELSAVVLIPIKHVVMGELDNVIPLVGRASR